MFSLVYGVWSVKCGGMSVEYGVWNLKCSVLYVKYEVLSLQRNVVSVKGKEAWRVKSNVFNVECGA